MRSSACVVVLALLCAAPALAAEAMPAATASATVPASAPTSAPASAPTREAVNAELKTLRADPDLGGTHTQKTLRLKDSNDKKKREKTKPTSLPDWLKGFATWITEATHVLVWALAALALALFLVSLRHWVRVRGGAVTGRSATLPSHVRDLDIRPESLPDRIGAAAAALWRAGEHRAALSLLYRGALSRLVHEHAVPIRAASTEGECLALAATRLAPERSAFFARLVQAWQLAVYGARLPEDGSVLALCSDFDNQFHPAPAAPAAA